MNAFTKHPLALVGCETPVIEESKLMLYALNPVHERGRHKARVFKSALGFDLTNWSLLVQAIIDLLCLHPAEVIETPPTGTKYRVVLPITGPNNHTVPVLTAWQYDRQADGSLSAIPRLVSLRVV
jgi:hypothetical protein